MNATQFAILNRSTDRNTSHGYFPSALNSLFAPFPQNPFADTGPSSLTRKIFDAADIELNIRRPAHPGRSPGRKSNGGPK